MDRELLKKGLEELGLDSGEKRLEQFARYSALLTDWNKKINLTAITDPRDVSVKHFLDSILLLKASDIPIGARVIDVGTGAGFPGIPVKIMREDISLTLLDSLQKRVNFLNEVTGALRLTETEAVHGRAEEFGTKPSYRETYDAAFSRAVADLEILSEYCLPFVKKGGIFVALKSSRSQEELERAKPMIGNLGGVVREVKELDLPQSDMKRLFVIIEKKRETPPRFPRKNSKIKKKKS